MHVQQQGYQVYMYIIIIMIFRLAEMILLLEVLLLYVLKNCHHSQGQTCKKIKLAIAI